MKETAVRSALEVATVATLESPKRGTFYRKSVPGICEKKQQGASGVRKINGFLGRKLYISYGLSLIIFGSVLNISYL